MAPVDIARWQFGITTVYHFLMVPLTIGLGLVVAALQTAHTRTGAEHYRALTAFFARIFLLNFAMGVVTGIVQEFQFGLAWSAYSRFVGDVFGAPLAMEALLAFFLESVFLGLWMFGTGRLSPWVRTGCLWLAVLGSVASAYFILCANSWMQHPVGASIVDGKPRLTDIGALLGNNTAIVAFGHTMFGSLAVAGAVLLGVSVYRLRLLDGHEHAWRTSLRIGAWLSIACFAGLGVTGDAAGKLMFEQQPMKMAAAEALCRTEQPASFSVFALGDVRSPDCASVKSLTVPFVLSFLAKGDFDSPVAGIEELRTGYAQRYGSHYPDEPSFGALAGQPIDYQPYLPVTYWGFRLMIGFGAVSAGFGALLLWLTRGGRTPAGRWPSRAAVALIFAPFAANAAGWIFTELGRQPFVVAPNPAGDPALRFFTAQAVSPGVSAAELLTSLISLTAVYGLLAVVELTLIVRTVRRGVPEPESAPEPEPGDVLAFAYRSNA